MPELPERKNILCVLTHGKARVSDWVRAKSLDEHSPADFRFTYVNLEIPRWLRVRYVYEIIVSTNVLLSILFIGSKPKCIYIIKSESVLLIRILKAICGVPVVSDINDPIHTFDWVGIGSTTRILALSNGVVFESPEYSDYLKKYFDTNFRFFVREDFHPFDAVFVNQSTREKQLVWFGSNATSEVLLDIVQFLRRVSDDGYKIQFLGCSHSVLSKIEGFGIPALNIERYNDSILFNVVTRSLVSIVPMPLVERYTLRGNLKARISMHLGCATFVSNMPMHRRLIDANKNGYLIQDFNSVVLPCRAELERAGREASSSISKSFSRRDKVASLCEFLCDL